MSLAKLCRRRMHTPSSASIDQRPASQPPLVPEFTQLIHQSDSLPLPPHARKLSTPKRGYVASAPENHITVGIHVSLEGFVQEALRLQHPTEQQPLFSKEVRANVPRLTSKTVHQVAKRAHRTREEVDHSCNRALRRREETERSPQPSNSRSLERQETLDLGRDVLLELMQSCGDKDLDASLFEATLKEVEKGFIQGPISKDELR